MPHVDAAGLGGLELNLIVPEPDFFAARKLRNLLGDLFVSHQRGKRLTRVADVDDLPNNPAGIAGEVGD